MRKPIAILLGMLLPLLGLAGIGRAQTSIQVSGVIQSVDCQSGAVVLVDSGSGVSNTVVAAPSTPVLVGSTSIDFCGLEQYVGAPASAWLIASGSQFVATRIDVVGPAAATSPSVPAPEPAPAQVESPLPIVGIVLGTIIVASLVYLLTRDHDRYYRYPYYGAYYHQYYRPYYRPYLGPVPGLAPIITVPPVIAGPVLGTCTVGGLDYLVARERDGRYYRYPYYGPYRQHYYRPEYRAYYGPYRDAPVRNGDARWSGPVQQNLRIQGPLPQPDPRHAPAGQGGPPQWNHDPRNNAPAQQAPPQWNPPAVQHAPAPQPDPRHAPVGQGGPPQWNHDPRNNAPARQTAPPRSNQPAMSRSCEAQSPTHQCVSDAKH